MSTTQSYTDLAVFKGMDEAQCKAVVSAGQYMKIGDGQMVIQQGEASRELFIILSGGVEVVRFTGVAYRSLVIIKPGYCFGEIGLFTGEMRTAGVRTVAESELVAIQPQEIDRLTTQNPIAAARFIRNILEIVSHRFADMNTNLSNMVFWLGN